MGKEISKAWQKQQNPTTERYKHSGLKDPLNTQHNMFKKYFSKGISKTFLEYPGYKENPKAFRREKKRHHYKKSI